MAGKWARALAFSLAGLALASSAAAEHEVFYRYVVLGYVKDVKGNPLRGVTIKLVREKTGFSYLADTDARGFYVIIARLGDESVGEHLQVKAGALATTLVARFDPRDHATNRGTRLDFLGKRAVEQPALFASTLKRFLAQ